MLENKKVEEIVSHIKSKEISVREVVQFYLERIQKYNHFLNAIVSKIDDEKIIKEADEKDKKNNLEEKKSSLFGLPIAVKELFDVHGLPTSYGLDKFKNKISKKNSMIVDRLKKNGAIIIGKTNMPELAVGCHTTNSVFGTTSNVYDHSKSAGGSSGGAAVAVAADLVPFADGTDMMGSCRNPAAFANIYGFRPTPGLIPEDRQSIQMSNEMPILSTTGCLARTPNEMTILLDAIKGKSSLDPYSFDTKQSFQDIEFKDNEISNLKVAWLSDMNGKYKFENEILEKCETTLNKLEKNNLKVEFMKPQINADVLWKSWTCLRAKNLFDNFQEMNIKNTSDLGKQAEWEYLKGKEINNQTIRKSLEQRNIILNEVNKIFNNFDFLILPSAQIFPFDKNLKNPEKINQYKLDTYHRYMEVVVLSSLLGLPTISVPIGFNKDGLPMGMQIIANKNQDLKVIAFAKKYEEVFKNSKIKPKLKN